ncbi:imelysin [Leptospira inadai serovar Lyme str. 10]|uniref:Imelysin n=2 Tax=Leptospira inadai serovar Lyme TaxID=293084 RepID=V6HF17_9LEPT|nr:imelysin family protein [Leptospira inadai]EQA38083.1 imelysin [Leptospira inadai serovar Lyme str. 10]PNV75106.1 iron-regulated protein a [Leptospira inadai serovar Lyme]
MNRSGFRSFGELPFKRSYYLRRIFSGCGTILTSTILFFSVLSCNPRNASSSDSSLVNGFLYAMFNSYDPKPFLQNMGRNIIPPLYADLNSKAQDLVTKATALSSCNAGTLSNVQASWLANISAVKKVELYRFGPSNTYYPLFDAWPGEATKTVSPESPPSNGDMDDLDASPGFSGTAAAYIGTLDKDAKGLPAIEYVIYVKPASYGASALSCSDMSASRYQLLLALVNDYAANVAALAAAWAPNGASPYGEQLATAGNGSTVFPNSAGAFNTVFASAIRELSTMKDGKLEAPAGLAKGGNGSVINLSLSESRFSGNSIQNLRNNLSSFKTFYLGGGGIGLSDYVTFYSPSLDTQARTQISLLESTLNSFNSVGAGNMAAIIQAVTQLNTLLTILNTQLAAIVGSGVVSGKTGDGD